MALTASALQALTQGSDANAWRVIVEQAVEIAKKFSTPSSAPFINGVLDGIRRSLYGPREAARPKRPKPAPAETP